MRRGFNGVKSNLQTAPSEEDDVMMDVAQSKLVGVNILQTDVKMSIFEI